MSLPDPKIEALRAMMAKSREKLDAARREMDAGFYGEVASRAYYAVFHAISAALFSRDLSFSSHAQVVGEFNRSFVKSGEFPPDTTRKLQRLFEDRQTADYDVIATVDELTARQDLNDAESIVASCAALLGV